MSAAADHAAPDDGGQRFWGKLRRGERDHLKGLGMALVGCLAKPLRRLRVVLPRGNLDVLHANTLEDGFDCVLQ